MVYEIVNAKYIEKGPKALYLDRSFDYFFASSAGAAGAAAASTTAGAATTGAGAGAGSSFLPQATSIAAATSRIDSDFILEPHSQTKAKSVLFDVLTASTNTEASTNGFG